MDSNIGHNFSLKLYYFTHYSIFLCLVTHVTSTSFFYPIYYLIIFLFIERKNFSTTNSDDLTFFCCIRKYECIKVSLKKSSYYRVLDSTLVQYLFSCTLKFGILVKQLCDELSNYGIMIDELLEMVAMGKESCEELYNNNLECYLSIKIFLNLFS